MMTRPTEAAPGRPASADEPLFRALLKAILAAAGVVVLLWFLKQIQGIVILFFFALILALSLNPPVSWLEQKGVKRVIAALGVFFAAAGVIGLIGWQVGPRLAEEAVSVVESIPTFARQLSERLVGALEGYPDLQDRVRLTEENLAEMAPRAMAVLAGAWGFALTLASLVIILLVLISVILYMLINPRPLLEGYIRAMPEHLRDPAMRAFSKSSTAVAGWMASNVIVGSIEAVAVFFFLTFMGIPGALVWAALALFAELVPKLGPYLMAVPPILVSLSIDPGTTLWVVLFYWALNELMGDIVTPRIRSSTMNLHPVFILFVTLALAAAFGLVGALIATPFAGFVKAYYEEFYLANRSDDGRIGERTDMMLRRETGEEEGEESGQ